MDTTTPKELKVGTLLRTSEHGIFLYEIAKIQKSVTGDPRPDFYLVRPTVVGEQIEIPACWMDETTLRDRYVVVGESEPGDPGSDAPVGPAGDAAAPDPSATLRGRIARLQTLGRLAITEGLNSDECRELNGLTFDLAEAVGLHDTPEIVRHWDGNHCPYCGSAAIDCEAEHEFDDFTGWQSVFCNDCQRQYTEDFVLVGATSREGEGPTLATTFEGEVLSVIDNVRDELHALADELGQSEEWAIIGVTRDLRRQLDRLPKREVPS